MIYRTTRNQLKAYGSIWQGDGTEFVRELNRLESLYSDIDIHLHTYGGSVFDGNLMINAIEKSPANITIVIDGVAASMGALLLVSAKKVKMVENGYIMVHNPSSGAWGNAVVLESEAKLLRMMEKDFENRLVKRTGKKLSEIKEWLSKDTWFSAEEALKNNLITEVIASAVEPVEMESEVAELGELEMYNRYACALLTEPSLGKNYLSNKDMKQMLITALALVGVTAQSSDTAVLEAVQDKLKGLQDSLDVEKQARLEAEKELGEYINKQVSAMIEQASKKAPVAFSEDDKKMYKNIGLNSGVEALAHVLSKASQSTAPNLTGQIGRTGAKGRESWTFDQWQKEDPKGLEKMSAENPDAFKELFNQKYQK